MFTGKNVEIRCTYIDKAGVDVVGAFDASNWLKRHTCRLVYSKDLPTITNLFCHAKTVEIVSTLLIYG